MASENRSKAAHATKTEFLSSSAPRPAGRSTSSELLPPAEPSALGSEHLVQFYEHDAFLVSSVGRFLIAALSKDAVLLIVATDAHRQAIEAHLEAAGADLSHLRDTGRYVALDAAEVLSRVMVGDLPDPPLMDLHIGSEAARLASGGRRVSVFGEMGAQLWSDGKGEAAIQLEAWWNSLGQRQTLSLLCAYPMHGFGSASARRAFLQVCRAYSTVLPAETYSEQSDGEKLQTIASLQQKAAAYDREMGERKRAEEVIRRSEEELTAFVETAPVGLHWTDANGNLLWANRAELELLGYSWSEYVGHPVADFHVDQPAIAKILERLARGERIENHEAQLRGRTGEIKTVLMDVSVLWVGGQFVRTQWFTRDITAQRRAEDLCRHSAAIVEWSDDAILSKSLEGVITSWNRSAERIFGYTAEEAIGQPIVLLIPPDRLAEEPEILAKLRRGERVDHFETVRRRKDGSLVNISLTVSPIKDANGRVLGASKIARDITEKKRAEEALEAAREELACVNEMLERRVQERTASLREAVAQLEEFSYTVSHDLRAPLRGMLVYSQALLEDYGSTLNPESRHCLSRIAENANRLDKMVTDVLTFSRISRSELRMERVNLNGLVREIIKQYPAMQACRAHIEVGRLEDVMGHEPSLIQILSNLLSNAVKFVPSGVTPEVRVWTEKLDGGVRLHIRDNGIGINPALQGRLFMMFERMHPNLPYEGTGVGLAIVRKAANRMGGDVGVESDGVTGSDFWVQLPAPVSP